MNQHPTLLDTLYNRVSIPARLLCEPGPTSDQIRSAIRAAVTAPDHGNLRPWHFVVVSGEALTELAKHFGHAFRRRKPDASAEEVQLESQKALRSPCIVIIYVNIDNSNPKVPPTEQIVSGGAAAQNLLLAFEAMGLGSILLTGANARDPKIKEALGIPSGSEIIGFVYVGSRPPKLPQKRRLKGDDFEGHLSFWGG